MGGPRLRSRGAGRMNRRDVPKGGGRSLASIAVGTIILLAMGTIPASAADWPTKTVRVIVPYAAGSATDLIPRTVFETVSTQVGHTIIVDNRLGGGTTVG